MARVPYLEIVSIAGQLGEQLRSRPPLNIYRMLAHGGQVASGFLSLGSAILQQSQVSPRIREMVIIRTGVLCGSAYEVFQHTRIGRKCGITDVELACLKQKGVLKPTLSFTRQEQVALEFTDQQVANTKVDQQLFSDLSQHFNLQEMVELEITVGFYMMVSRFLETFEVDLEPEPVKVGLARFE